MIFLWCYLKSKAKASKRFARFSSNNLDVKHALHPNRPIVHKADEILQRSALQNIDAEFNKQFWTLTYIHKHARSLNEREWTVKNFMNQIYFRE